MKMTELQFAGMTISLSTLGQVDLSDNDSDMLTNLAFLLEEASKNVAKALAAQRVETEEPIDYVAESHRRIAWRIDHPHDPDRMDDGAEDD